MPPKNAHLYLGNLDLNEFIPLTFFSTPHIENHKKLLKNKCNHFGYLQKDGMYHKNKEKCQRYYCSRCGQRFGNDINELDLLSYQDKMKQLLYELFFEGCKQTNIAKRWEIPQDRISKFKKQYVNTVIRQNPDLLNAGEKKLPKGVIYGDETYMGKRSNSNTEIIFVSDNFELLSTTPVKDLTVGPSILRGFANIPQIHRNAYRILVTDGQPEYCTIARNSSHRVIHVQQYHGHKKLGKITLNKYEAFGPHLLHYQIHTHWKIFAKGIYEFGFHWEIKFIKGTLYAGRGRPTKTFQNSPEYQLWKLKKEEYEDPSFCKAGKARVLVNPNTGKISLRQGSKLWMKKIFEAVLPIFKGKCITNNRSESKHSQIKRKGSLIKEPDPCYNDQLFMLLEYTAQHGHLPPCNVRGRPLYTYLVKPKKPNKFSLVIRECGKKRVQIQMNSFF